MPHMNVDNLVIAKLIINNYFEHICIRSAKVRFYETIQYVAALYVARKWDNVMKWVKRFAFDTHYNGVPEKS